MIPHGGSDWVSYMQRISTLFLQLVIVLFGMGTLAFMLWEPHVEGRNARASFFEIYFKDAFLAYVYVASIPYFVALQRAFKAVGYAGQNKAFTPETVGALRTIKRCALAVIGFVVVSFAFMVFGDPEDRPPGIVMRALVTFGATVVAVTAAMFERILKEALELKSENTPTP